MPAQHVSDRLVRDVVAEVRQRTGDPVVSPARVLARHLHNQSLYLGIDPRPTRVGAVLRAIELPRHQHAKPAENRLGLCHLDDFRQSFPPKLFPDFGQSGAFRVRQPQPGWRMRPQDSVLGGEVIVGASLRP